MWRRLLPSARSAQLSPSSIAFHGSSSAAALGRPGVLAAASTQLLVSQRSSWPAVWRAWEAVAPWPVQVVRCLAAAPAPRESKDPYTTPPRNYTQLLQHIQAARDLSRLEALLASYGPKFDALHIAAAMARLPLLMDPVHPGEQQPRHVAKQRSRQPAHLMAQLQRLALSSLDRMYPREVAHMAWATARTKNLLPRGCAPREDVKPSTADTPAADTSEAAEEAGAAARRTPFALPPPPPTQQDLWKVPPTLQQQQQQQRISTQSFIAALLQQLRRHSKAHGGATLSGADASQLMYALGRLRVGPGDKHAPWLARQLSATASKGGLTAKQAALVVWGMGRLGWQQGMVLRGLAGLLVRERLYLRPAYAAAALGGLARLRRKEPAVAEAVFQVMEEQMYATTPWDLSVLVNSAASLVHPLPPSLATALQQRALELLPRFTPLQLSLLMAGLARQGQLGGQLALAVAEGIAAEEAVQMAPADAVRFLSSFVACKELDLDTPAVQRATGLMAATLVKPLTNGAVLARRAAVGGLTGAATAQLATSLVLIGLEPWKLDRNLDVYQALAEGVIQALQAPLTGAGRPAWRHAQQMTVQQLAQVLRAFNTSGTFNTLIDGSSEQLASSVNTALEAWVRRGGLQRHRGGSGEAAAQGGEAEQEKQQQGLRRDAQGATDVLLELAAANRLRPDTASILAAELEGCLRQLKPRTVSMLLGALTQQKGVASSEGVRNLLVRGALPWVQQQLEQPEQLSLTTACNTAAALASAVQQGVLAASAPALVERLYGVVGPRLAEVTEQQAGKLRSALRVVPQQDLEQQLEQVVRAGAAGRLA